MDLQSMEKTMQTEIKTITPEIAKQMLAQSNGNRTLKQRKVSEFADAMKVGEWSLTGDAIRFDTSGTLIDGHHRLEAINQSGCTVDTLVITNLPIDVITKIDTGTSRSAADMMAFTGNYTNRKIRAAAIRVMEALRLGHLILSVRLSNQRYHELVNATPERFEVFLSDATRIKSGISGSHTAAVLTAATAVPGYDDDALSFIDGCVTGANLSHNDPRLALRNFFMNAKMNKRTFSQDQRLNAFIQAWNAYATNRPLRVIRYRERPKALIGSTSMTFKPML